MKDAIEVEYERAITLATQRGDNDHAHELSVGLAQYREYFKIDDRERTKSTWT